MDGAVVWFRNDLRLGDNPAWSAATSDHDEVTALFVIDPVVWDAAPGGRRSRLGAHLAALDASLAERGGRLRVERGDPVAVLPAVASGRPVYWNADVTPYARRRDAALAEAVVARVHDGRYAVPAGSVLTGDGQPYRVFTPFYRRWAETEREPWPDPGDAAVAADPGAGLPASESDEPAGEQAALERLHAFEARADAYQEERDFPGVEATSRLSEDLRFGTISPRTIEREIGTDTKGRAGFVRQLAWREFCAQLLLAFPRMATLELRPEYRTMRWRDDPAGVEAWKHGRTGYPIVDAGMRELAATGWMHNRVRMLAASFLVKDLLVDWRVGERHFADLLHDYDPAQNSANWQWVAGTGADAAPYFRIFNPVTQGRRFDAAGDYVRRWVPELAGIEGIDIHAPWEMGPLDLAAAGVTLGETYPYPIVDHAVARDETIAAYEAARSESEAR